MSRLLSNSPVIERADFVDGQRRMQQPSKQSPMNWIIEEEDSNVNTDTLMMIHQQNTIDTAQHRKRYSVCSIYSIVDQLETIYEEQEE